MDGRRTYQNELKFNPRHVFLNIISIDSVSSVSVF